MKSSIVIGQLSINDELTIRLINSWLMSKQIFFCVTIIQQTEKYHRRYVPVPSQSVRRKYHEKPSVATLLNTIRLAQQKF